MTISTTTKVLALSIGKGLTTVTSVMSAMIMSRVLSEGQLGTYRQSMLAYDLMVNIFCLGIGNGVYYFLPTEKQRARGVVFDALIVLFAMGVLSGLCLFLGGRYFFSDRFSNPELKVTLSYLAFLPFLMMPAGLINSVLVTVDKVTHLTFYNVASNLFLVVSMIVACWVWKNPTAVVVSKILADALFGLVALTLIWKFLPKDDWRPSLAFIKTMVSFSIPLGMATLFGMFQINLDRILVSSFCTPEQFAVYSNGAIEIPFIGIITASIALVIQPEMRRKIANGQNMEAIGLFRMSAEKSAVILIPCMVFLFVCAEPLMVSLFSEKYIDSATPFRIYLLLLPTRIVLYGSIMVALGLNRLVLYRTALAAFANLMLGCLLINWFGAPGAAVASVLSTSLIAVGWSLFAISRAVPCSIAELLPFRKIASLFGLAVLAAIPSILIRWNQCFKMPHLELAISGMLFFITLTAIAIVFRNELLLNSWAHARAYLNSRIESRKMAV